MEHHVGGDSGQRGVQMRGAERRQLDHARPIKAGEGARDSRPRADQTGHTDAAGEQPLHEYRPNESGAACHERRSEGRHALAMLV